MSHAAHTTARFALVAATVLGVTMWGGPLPTGDFSRAPAASAAVVGGPDEANDTEHAIYCTLAKR